MKCKYCNTELKDGVKFCHNCGKIVNTSIKCVNCGKTIEDGISFCPYCGSKQFEQQSDNFPNKIETEEIKKTKPKKTSRSKDIHTESSENVVTHTVPNNVDKAEYREFAIEVLKYMRRSKSDRQITLYTNKYASTLEYGTQNEFNNDFAPFIFAEAIRKIEAEKRTSIHHIEAEEIATCIAEHKGELIKAKEDEDKRQEEYEKNKALPEEEQRIKLLVKITSLVGIIIALAPFFITGFAFNIIWYLLIIVVIFAVLAALLTDCDRKDDLQDVLKILIFIIACGLLMYLWGPINPNYN